jgi:hypothetical protein
MFKNPLNADQNIDDLVVELEKEGSDAKTVAKLYTKIIAKGAATGLLITSVIVAVGATLVVVTSALIEGADTPETEEEEDSE